MCPPPVGKWSVFALALGKQFNHSLNVPNLTNKGRQCISYMIFLNMYEFYPSGMCLLPAPNGTFTRKNR